MPNRNKDMFFFEAINEALVLSMKKNKNVLLIGLGVDDPKGIVIALHGSGGTPEAV